MTIPMMTADEYRQYLESGVLPERHRLPGDVGFAEIERTAIPLDPSRVRKPLIPFTPPHDQNRKTEAAFSAQVKAEAKTWGWRGYHTYNSMRSPEGYPDWTFAHPAFGVIWLELKGPKGRISDAQRGWIATLRASGQRAYIVHPPAIGFISELFQGYEPDTSQWEGIE